MKIVVPFICKQEEETVNDVLSQRACELSGTKQDRLTCSCRHRDCPNNGTKCFDNPDGRGIIQLPCFMEKPPLSLCSTSCMLGYLEGMCTFYGERVDYG